MRRISIAFALTLALFTLLAVSVSSAQQAATTTHGVASPVGNPDTVINCVGAQTGRIAVFTQSLPPNITLCNSGIYEASPYGTGAIGILNPHPVSALDVAGDVNLSGRILFVGNPVLQIPGGVLNDNTAVGIEALGNGSTTGMENTAYGAFSMQSNTNGSANSAIGVAALSYNTIGINNTAVGTNAMLGNTAGNGNTAVGVGAISNGKSSSGNSNTAIGIGALLNNVAGNSNTVDGAFALQANTSGSNNIAVGYTAANNVSGSNSNNIHIGSQGFSGDNGTIRIGDPSNETTAYIAGIYNATSSSGVPVYVNNQGQLGTQTSSLRFKEQVRDMGDSTDALTKLRPVIFLYKPEYANGDRSLQYGLIAEEVAKVYPELVASDKDGSPKCTPDKHGM